MENSEQQPLINELIQGRELVKQLRIHLNPSSSPVGELLIERILSSFDNTLSMINKNDPDDGIIRPIGSSIGMLEYSPYSSPRSYDTDRRDASKKRKNAAQWKEQVQVGPETGLEGPGNDGYSWRKYGQKDIHGAKHPRGYYRCTHSKNQGCLATKQVQKSEDNPLIFHVTYRGRHTCQQTSHRATQNPNQEDQIQNQERQKQKQPQETFSDFKTGIEFKIPENSYTGELTTSFSFPLSIEDIKIDNTFTAGSFSPPFISPATSGTNYFSQGRMNDYGGGGLNLQTSESDYTEIISATTSASNSSIVNLDFTLDSLELDPNFVFNNPGFFN